VVCKFLPLAAEVKMNFCRWFQQSVSDKMADTDPVSYTYKSRFHLSGYVNIQNNRYWSAENPHCIHEVPKHYVQKWGAVCHQ
jgi:hypothetical protein